jgi:RNA polymerase sigma-70 factor (family 1)
MTEQTVLYLQNKVAYTADEAAYKQLYLHFHPGLYRLAFSFLKNPDDADLVVSDLLLKVWEMGPRLGTIDNLRLYLFKSARNAIFTRLNTNKVKRNLESEQACGEMPANAGMQDPDQRILLRETSRQIEKAVQQLSPQCQMVFRLIREEGLNYKQVQQVMDISQNTIETHMRIALKKIRTQLEAYLEGKR